MYSIDRPKVSVVVATYNRPDRLAALAYALNSQTHTDLENDLELIVLNDGSTKDYTEVYRYIAGADFRSTVRDFPRRDDNGSNSYHLKNLGAGMATHPLLWFLGDDNIVDDHSLLILRLHFALYYAGGGMIDSTGMPLVLIPHVANDGDPEPYQAPFGMYISASPSGSQKRCGHYVSFDGLAMLKSTFALVDGIDEDYAGHMGFADCDLGHRLWLAYCAMMETDGIQIYQSDGGVSLRDIMLKQDEKRGDAHHNGRLFIEKWGRDTAALYGIVWDKNDEEKYGWVYNDYTKKFERSG